MAKKIVFTVTNDLSYDQRMQRICSSLAAAGYEVTLVGRSTSGSLPLAERNFKQKRLSVFFRKGKFFYIEFNIRLFFYLLIKRCDAICAIDLDTIFPCYIISKLKNTIRIYDAHELFCEMQEIVARPRIYRFWKWLERRTVPHFEHGYTVNAIIAEEFKKMYGVQYETVRNIAVYEEFEAPEKTEKYFLYQGAVNEGRCFEQLIPAMAHVPARLIVCGTGNFMEQAVELARQHQLGEKLIFKGPVLPAELRQFTRAAHAGITLFEATGISNYYSLANRFFDYIHAGIPQVCVDYPAYRELNNLYEVAVLIEEPVVMRIANALNLLLEDESLYKRLERGCQQARRELNWQAEEKKLLSFYERVFS